MTTSPPPDARNARIYVATGNVAVMDILSVREQAAQRDMVTKGVLPGPAPDRRENGSVRALVWARGPDGTFGWQRPQVAAPGLQIAPEGTAGR